MAWAKNGTPHTLSSAADDLTISDLTAKKFNLFMWHEIATGNLDNMDAYFNNDTNSVYAIRESTNAAADTTSTSQTGIRMAHGNAAWDYFKMFFVLSLSGEEKLVISNFVSNDGSGAGNPPNRTELIVKFVPSPDANITRIDSNNAGAGSFDTDSNMSALGTD